MKSFIYFHMVFESSVKPSFEDFLGRTLPKESLEYVPT